MTLSIELPAPLQEELALEAEREGLTVSEQATLIIYLATALLKERPDTPFRNAVRSVLEDRRIDPRQLSSALEELKKLCIVSLPEPASKAFDEHDRSCISLRHWRDAVVHNPASVSLDSRTDPPIDPTVQIERRSIRGKYAYINFSSDDHAREKQIEIDREDRI
jgi:hypothetical protein